MMPWWGWVIVWTVLILASVALLAHRGWRVWGSAKVLAREVERAGVLVAELESRADELRDLEPPPTAVTQDPRRVRAQYQEQRATTKAARRIRRAEHLPPWARVD